MSRHPKQRPLLDLAKQIIAIDSRNSRGTTQLARFIGTHLKSYGFAVSYQRAQLHGVRQHNLVARAGPQRGRPLMINTHLDTVETHPQEWTRTGGNPLRSTIYDGQLYGLGSADTKLALASQLIALKGLDLRHLKRPLLITGTYGEEAGLIGVNRLMAILKSRSALILNSEPTELLSCNANYGFRIYRIKGHARRPETKRGDLVHLRFKGAAAHSASPHHGRNAIDDALNWLGKFGKRAHLVAISGGLAPNIVAPSCEITILSDEKSLKGLKACRGQVLKRAKGKAAICSKAFQNFVTAFPQQIEMDHTSGEMTNLGVIQLREGHLDLIFSQRFSHDIHPNVRYSQWRQWLRHNSLPEIGHFRLTMKSDNPAFYQDRSSSLVKEVRKTLRSMGRPTRIIGKYGCTEASIFARANAEVVTIGPGKAYGNAHQPNESIEVKQLEMAVEFYRRMIMRMCF